MTPTTTAKKLVAGELARLGLSYDRLSARTIDFTDLARASCVFVTVHGWTPNPQAADLKKFASEHGFRVQFKGEGLVA